MGNSQSSLEEHQHQHTRAHSHPNNRPSATSQQQRRNSPLAVAPRAPAVVPVASSPSTSTSNTHAHATVSHTSLPPHGRARSSTTATAQAVPINDPALVEKIENSSTGTIETRTNRATTIASISSQKEPEYTSPPASQPVNVPQPANPPPVATDDEANLSSSLSHADYSLAPSDYSRPPRLPLPIEEEVHSPGSPIITPQDLSTALNANGSEGTLPRRTSVLSSTTVDDEDVGETDALEATSLAPTVPTKIEWLGAGEKIYVTGTFVNWERKFKLHGNHDKPGFSATLQLKPGTHHVKFLVDGDMITSEDLPTTVDFTNILVNYIEVIAPLPPALVQLPKPAQPIDIPGATDESKRRSRVDEPSIVAEITSENVPTPTVETDLVATLAPTGQNDVPSSTTAETAEEVAQPNRPTIAKRPAAPAKPKRPRPKYTNQIPEYLHDLDVHTNPEDERCQRANRVITVLPQPPSLPMFMNKSILNMATPHKDDASVLNMPNHTILNHLATSSIKSGVLATSGTTRYKRKFLTTIMFKPTSDDG